MQPENQEVSDFCGDGSLLEFALVLYCLEDNGNTAIQFLCSDICCILYSAGPVVVCQKVVISFCALFLKEVVYRVTLVTLFSCISFLIPYYMPDNAVGFCVSMLGD